MPYCSVTRPSLALGVLTACLHDTGITCATEYANLRFADFIGVEALRVIESTGAQQLVGEWTFSSAAFPNHHSSIEDVLGRQRLAAELRRRPELTAFLESFLDVATMLRRLTPSFVDQTARRLLARRPRIVGCTSTFEQHTASLALLRRVKELDPTVVTMLGGANCEAEMGWAVIQEFPWVDLVVSGEADELFAPLCRLLLDGGVPSDHRQLPKGVLGAAHVEADSYGPGRMKAPRAVVERLDQSPVPDFDEYFAALGQSELGRAIVPSLSIETSRGCWWGQKSQCTFCGLNGDGMRYRAKSHARVLYEFDALATRYGVTRFQVADNILDMQHLRTVMPALVDAGAPYSLFYEIKANLKREQVATLAAAGVTRVQPGIEALHDDLLKLIAKGNTAVINLELLKHLREFGIGSTWLMLVGFPGEQDAWHAEVAAMLPSVSHLQPPSGVVQLRYDRFSVYHQDPVRYDLHLVPYPSYAAVYPSSPDRLQELAYFFRDANGVDDQPDTPGLAALKSAAAEWQRLFAQPIPPVLCATDRGDMIEIFDTRPAAVSRRHTLTELDATVYRGCQPPIARESLRRGVSESGVATEAEVDEAIERLLARRIVLEASGRLVALGVPGDLPPLRDRDDQPGGWIKGEYLSIDVAATRARERLRMLVAHGEAVVPALHGRVPLDTRTYMEASDADADRHPALETSGAKPAEQTFVNAGRS